MKFDEAVRCERRPALDTFLKKLGKLPSNQVYSTQQIVEKFSMSLGALHNLMNEPNLAHCRLRQGRNVLWGSPKGIERYEAYLKAQGVL